MDKNDEECSEYQQLVVELPEQVKTPRQVYRSRIGINYTYSSVAIVALCIVFLCFDFQLYDNIQHESRLNITSTVKAVMLDHVNSYILEPIGIFLVEQTQFPNKLPFLQANHVSVLGVFAACLAAYLVLSDNLCTRQLAVLVYFVRQFLDDLDGLVARVRIGIDANKQVSLTHTSGYVVDGFCDLLGSVVFVVAVYVSASNRRAKKTSLLPNSQSNLSKIPTLHSFFTNPLFKHYFLIGLQMALSSMFWNYFLNKYHEALDPDISNGSSRRTPIQEEIFKSSLMFLIMWLWRILNPHAITNYVLASVWLNCSTRFAKCSSRYVFWILLGTSLLSEVYYVDIYFHLQGHRIQK